MKLLYQIVDTGKLLRDIRKIDRTYEGDLGLLEEMLGMVRGRFLLADGFSRIQADVNDNNFYNNAVKIYERLLEKIPDKKEELSPYSASKDELKRFRDKIEDAD